MPSKLTPAEQALFTAKRKEAYLRLHPETAAGVAGGKATVANLSTVSFADDQAEKTGQSARNIRRDAERGEKVSAEVLEAVRGSAGDKLSFAEDQTRCDKSVRRFN